MIQNFELEKITKKQLLLILLITFGAELALYGSRYSYFLSDVYNFIMIASIFVAYSLHPVFKARTKSKRTVKQTFYLFIKGFVIFTTATFAIDLLSNEFFQDFHQNYEEEVIEYSQNNSYIESLNDDFGIDIEGEAVNPFMNWLDSDGYSFFTDILAGFEEVSRLGYIILVLLILKLIFPKNWESGKTWIFWILALIISSIMFGIGHTLYAEQSLKVFIGTVVYYTNFGIILGLLLMWTRNLWLLIIIHATHNVMTSISWLYMDAAHILFYIIMVIALITIFFIEKYLFNVEKDASNQEEGISPPIVHMDVSVDSSMNRNEKA